MRTCLHFNSGRTLRLAGRIPLLALAIVCMTAAATAGAAADPFPLPECIRSNFAFWLRVYTHYDTTQAIIHDQENLQIIYGVIDLLPGDTPRAARLNQKRIKRTKAKYRRILLRLSDGHAPQNAEEAAVADLLGNPSETLAYRRAAERLRGQVGQKDRFQEGIVRSGAYLPEMKRIFREAGLPEDLAFLPHVESSFNPQARSRCGAVGIWQFLHATGSRFLTIDESIDERLDPIRSTEAASRYLAESYAQLDDWPLAITAYNHGLAGMLRAKRHRGDFARIIGSYRGRRFRFASRNFYAEFLAAREAAKNYRSHFAAIEIQKPLKHYEFRLPGYVPVQRLLTHYNLGAETLKRYNPALREAVFRGEKYIPRDYVLRLPARIAVQARGPTGIPHALLEARQKPTRFYLVRRGDTAIAIARSHRVPLAELIRINQLGSHALIFVNQRLRIPPVRSENREPA